MIPWDAAIGLPKEQMLALYEAQYAAAPNMRIEIFEDSFHFIMVDQQAAFLESLSKALAE